jgi:SAM-dependent methyltransferase
VPVRCRICDHESKLWRDRGDVVLYRCRGCGFMSGQPSRTVAAEEHYAAYYEHSRPPAPEVRYHELLQMAEAAIGCGRLLEVGAGTGGFVRVALARGWKVDATEISESGLRKLRETGATVFGGEVADAGFAPEQFDLVASFEVLEHLPAPLSHLREISRITRPGGLLVLSTPNFDGLSRRCLGLRWRVFDPEHLGYFTTYSLSRVLREAGYGSVRVSSRSLDVLSWRRGAGPSGVAPFDPHASARLRDAVEASRVLKLGKAAVNWLLRMSGLGDSLLVWARR